jgi:hypothetical protein
MTMCKQKSISLFSAIVILGVTSVANANNGIDNPLHPSYYQPIYVAPAAQTNNSDAAPYVDSLNPLSPSFVRTKITEWVSTGGMISAPYVDSSNPLSPRFQR